MFCYDLKLAIIFSNSIATNYSPRNCIVEKHGIVHDEQDFLERNSKKVKGGYQNLKQGSSMHFGV